MIRINNILIKKFKNVINIHTRNFKRPIVQSDLDLEKNKHMFDIENEKWVTDDEKKINYHLEKNKHMFDIENEKWVTDDEKKN